MRDEIGSGRLLACCNVFKIIFSTFDLFYRLLKLWIKNDKHQTFSKDRWLFSLTSPIWTVSHLHLFMTTIELIDWIFISDYFGNLSVDSIKMEF